MRIPGHASARLCLLPVIIVFTVTWALPDVAQQNSVLRVYQAETGTQAIFCETRLALENCRNATGILDSHLRTYPVAQLGTWTWVIVSSDYWSALGQELGLDSDSPAYTCIEDRMTLIDESMLTQTNPRRNADLLRKFELPLPKLIDFAVTHEIGHALCGFKDEYKAEAVGRRLRNGELPYCSVPPKTREKLPLTLQADVWKGSREPLGTGAK